MYRLKFFASLYMAVIFTCACNDSGTESDVNTVNKSDTRRNTTGTLNTLESDSASPKRDSAQHGGPDKPAQ